MNGISSSTSIGAPTPAASNSESAVTLAMLKRTLQGQKDQAAELVKMIEGKGQIIDIRA